jgi:hypothetical protein
MNHWDANIPAGPEQHPQYSFQQQQHYGQWSSPSAYSRDGGRERMQPFHVPTSVSSVVFPSTLRTSRYWNQRIQSRKLNSVMFETAGLL